MKELSKEVIEIDGTEYTLFLNRKGMVALEKYCEQEQTKLQDIGKKYKDFLDNLDENGEIVITDDTNPFEDIDEIEDIEKDAEVMRNIYKKAYWIMLYTNHQLSYSKVEELYDKAIEEYGEYQLTALVDQMIEEINLQPKNNGNLKNLKALKPKK